MIYLTGASGGVTREMAYRINLGLMLQPGNGYLTLAEDFPHWAGSAAEVFARLERHGIAANPLYRLGSKRVGCFPCVLTRHAELRRLNGTLPEVWDRIAELEALAGRSFFPPDFIPERFNTGRDPKTKLSYPTVADVRRYILGNGEEQLALYGETPACLSVYNLCE